MRPLSSPLSRFEMRPLTSPLSRLRFWFGLFIFHLGLPFRRRAKIKNACTQSMLHVQRSAMVEHCAPQYSLTLIARANDQGNSARTLKCTRFVKFRENVNSLDAVLPRAPCSISCNSAEDCPRVASASSQSQAWPAPLVLCCWSGQCETMCQGTAACADAQCRALPAPEAQQAQEAQAPQQAQQPKHPQQEEAVQRAHVTQLRVLEALWQSAVKLIPVTSNKCLEAEIHERWSKTCEVLN